MLVPLLRSRSFRSRVNGRGQHRFKLRVRAAAEAFGKLQAGEQIAVGHRAMDWWREFAGRYLTGRNVCMGRGRKKKGVLSADRKQCECGISAVLLACFSSTAEWRIQSSVLGSICLMSETSSSSFSYIISHPKIIILLQHKKTFQRCTNDTQRVAGTLPGVPHGIGTAPGWPRSPANHRTTSSMSIARAQGTVLMTRWFPRCNQQTRIADSASAEGSTLSSSVLFQINLFGYINV